MKKVIYISSTVFILILFIVFINSYHSDATPLELVEGFETKWGVKITEPEIYHSIWSAKNTSHGDGEWIKILIYKEAIPLEDLGQFAPITKDTIEEVQSYVTTFISNTKNAYYSDEKAAFVKVINNNPIKFEVGDYYYHKSENDGFDTFTAIYNSAEKKIYTFEWHQ